jgi:hypothetical protein
MKSHWD